jgi:hypothetical protein
MTKYKVLLFMLKKIESNPINLLNILQELIFDAIYIHYTTHSPTKTYKTQKQFQALKLALFEVL